MEVTRLGKLRWDRRLGKIVRTLPWQRWEVLIPGCEVVLVAHSRSAALRRAERLYRRQQRLATECGLDCDGECPTCAAVSGT